MISNQNLGRFIACILVLDVGLCACSRHDQTNAVNAESPRAEEPVRYVTVSEQPIQDWLELGAKVQPDPTKIFRIFSPASGRLVEVDVKPGDTVVRGQKLALIDSSDAGSARSDFSKATIEAQRASRAADREKVLFEHGAVAEKDYIDAKAVADSASAELARAQQRLEMLNLNPAAATDRVPLSSPARGVVLSVNGAPGEFSKSLDNADPLITLADLSTVWIVGDVYEKDIAKVQPGKQVTITFDSYPGQQWTGRIDSLSGALDPATRTLKVRVALAHGGQKLKPEMFATIRVDIAKHNAVVVPASSVIHQGQTTTVFVSSNGKPEQIKVTTGRSIDGMVEITSGLQVGQQIAVQGAELLTGGPSQQ
jgi:cobalt-zinc-cadmium efflux system membrane fusion protein